MLAFVDDLPLWILAALIVALRVVDVSLGTVRTIAVVQGWITTSVVLGFIEVLIWTLAISQVITRLTEHPVLVLAYSVGYAAGNATGILIERALGLGTCVLRLISLEHGQQIADTLRSMGQRVTTFEGQGRDGPRKMVFITCERRDSAWILARARRLDPGLVFTVDRVVEASRQLALQRDPNITWGLPKRL